MVTHANYLANVDHFNYWMGYKEAGVLPSCSAHFSHRRFSCHVRGTRFHGARQVTIPKFSPQGLCELIATRTCTHAVLVPTW